MLIVGALAVCSVSLLATAIIFAIRFVIERRLKGRHKIVELQKHMLRRAGVVIQSDTTNPDLQKFLILVIRVSTDPRLSRKFAWHLLKASLRIMIDRKSRVFSNDFANKPHHEDISFIISAAVQISAYSDLVYGPISVRLERIAVHLLRLQLHAQDVVHPDVFTGPELEHELDGMSSEVLAKAA